MRVVRNLDDLTAPPQGTVLTIGNFDGVHLGHREIFRKVLSRARQIAGTATVLTFEPHPLRLLAPDKAPPRINTPEEKVRLMEASCIDLLVILGFDRALAAMSADDFVRQVLVEKLAVQYLVVGYDYAFGRGRQGDLAFLRRQAVKYGFTLETLEPINRNGEVYSSTRIRQSLRAGDVASVVNVLGRNFTLDGQVVHGAARGRTLGFPTANLKTAKEILPANGVYAVKVKWRGHLYDAVVNIGYRPTFPDQEATVEIHLLDFRQDIYGETLRLYFVERLRGEASFPSVEALTQAIQQDIDRARGVLAEHGVVEYREYLASGGDGEGFCDNKKGGTEA